MGSMVITVRPGEGSGIKIDAPSTGALTSLTSPSDPRLFKEGSKLPELRKQYPKLNVALRVIERDLHTVDERVKEIQRVAKWAALMHTDELGREEAVRSLHAEQQGLVKKYRDDFFASSDEPFATVKSVLGQLGLEDTLAIGNEYGRYLERIFLSASYQARASLTNEVTGYDRIRGAQEAAVRTPEDRLAEAVNARYKDSSYPSYNVGAVLRELFKNSCSWLHGKITRQMAGTHPLGVSVNTKNMDWMHLGAVRGQYQGEPGYCNPSAMHSGRLLRVVGNFGIPNDASAAYQVVDTDIHVGSAVGVIGFDIKESEKERGLLADFMRFFGLAPKQYELVLTIAPSSLIHSVEGHERIDNRACVVGVALPLPKAQADELQNALRTPKDREAVFWSFFDRLPEGEAGKVISWIRDGMILPVAQAAFGHTKPWDQLSAGEQKFALRHMVIGEAGTICHEDLDNRWREISRLYVAAARA